LDLNSWDVSSVTNMDNMFNDMRSLERLDLSGWDVSSAAGMRSMFYNLGKLEHLDLSDWVFDAGQHDMIKSVFSRNRVFGAPSGRNFDVYLGDVDWSFILYDDGRRSVLRNNDLYCGLRDVDGGDINVDLGCVVD